jgi:hypothetical protein
MGILRKIDTNPVDAIRSADRDRRLRAWLALKTPMASRFAAALQKTKSRIAMTASARVTAKAAAL